MKQLQTYQYQIPAFGAVMIPAANDNFIVLASTGPVTVRGDTFGTLTNLIAGQGLKMVPFNRLELVDTSGAPNTVTILLTPAEFVNQVFSGSVSIVGGVLTDAQLRASAVPVRVAELPVQDWSSSATMGAGGVLTIFAAGANLNGALIHQMEAMDGAATYTPQSFVAKATLPINTLDGVVLAQSIAGTVGATIFSSIRREFPTRIPAGLGLFFVSGTAGGGGFIRNCRYTLL